MSKTTPATLERDLAVTLGNFKQRATELKNAHSATRKEILSDPMTSDLAKREKVDELTKQTRSSLDAMKSEQKNYVKELRVKIERELLGNQPTDAQSVLVRRDAADRARRIPNEDEALAVLQDATRGGDDSLAHAVGYRARNSGWEKALDAYREAQPGSADSATALATVEGLDRDPSYNFSTSATYSMPL
ncbi:hypothetical protein [Clavibacter californiensis]|uniref:Uncharacterized protein n=1 Tax=Clavibacter californiensis TaxID=1401995 RepID=A0ABX9N721_9MICO|nr:hypothetical protein [Clavibacter californiensis]RII93288.1 hypothetical protein DZF98_04770 [Clavibacter californiensis]UKF78917.1 hypothetical protein FGD68_08845 [Clavibacter californiensis]